MFFIFTNPILFELFVMEKKKKKEETKKQEERSEQK